MKSQFSTQIPSDLSERVRATVAGMQRLQPEYTLSAFAAEALEKHARDLEDEWNDGRHWPLVRRLRRGSRLTGE